MKTRRLSLLLMLMCFGASLANARTPNIVILVADDLGYGELGCQGNPEIPTPNIDSIAKNGFRFTQGYVTAPVCSPSRAGMMTGRYQTRFGHELNATEKQNLDEHIGLPLTEKTLAQCLKEAGYVTGAVGKWHLGATPKFHPQQRGFDEFFGFLHEGHYYQAPRGGNVVSFLRTNQLAETFHGREEDGDIVWHTNRLSRNEPPYNDDNPVLRGMVAVNEKEYLTDALTREAMSFIGRHQKEKFFLYLAYNAVHSPMQGQKKYLQRFEKIPDIQRRVFAAMLANMDDSIGAVLEQLRSLGLEKDTLIFFISDNGGPTDELTSSNKPLRGVKGTVWEGGVREPFLIQWKGVIPAGKVFTKPVISTDIFSTSVSAAEAKVPSDRPIDGVNLLPFLHGTDRGEPHKILFWRYGQNIALRQGDWKLVKQFERGKGKPEFQLFNLANDIGESKNVAHENPKIAADLRAALDAWNKQMAPPLWGAPPPKAAAH